MGSTGVPSIETFLLLGVACKTAPLLGSAIDCCGGEKQRKKDRGERVEEDPKGLPRRPCSLEPVTSKSLCGRGWSEGVRK